MRKVDLQQQAVTLIGQLSTENSNLLLIISSIFKMQRRETSLLITKFPHKFWERRSTKCSNLLAEWNLRYPHGNQCEALRVFNAVSCQRSLLQRAIHFLCYDLTEYGKTTKDALGWTF